MERVTLRIPEQQVDAVERMVEEGRFPTRSEAIRAAVRQLVSDRGPQSSSQSRRQFHADGGVRQ